MMISGKNLRMDNRRSSSYSSTVTLVVFVALCLVGVWMMTTTTVVPVDFSTPDNKPDVKEQVSVNDSPTQDASKGDASTGSNIGQEETSRDVSQRQGAAEKDNEIKEQGALQENPAKKSEERKDGSEDTSKDQTYSDENGKGEGAESNKDGGDVITDGEGGSQEKKLEKTSGGTGNSNEEEFSEQNESTNNEKQNNQDENNSSVEHTADEKVQGQIEEKVEETESKDTEQNSEENSEENSAREPTQDEKVQDQMEQKVEETESKDKDQNSGENKTMDQVSNEMLPDPAQSELLNETNTQSGSWATQATESKKEKEAQRPSNGEIAEYSWKLCNVSAGPDYIPCLDNVDAIMKLRTTKHYEHRERHCPEQGPTCLVPLPEGYKQPIKWPSSRDKVWYANVPHTKLAEIKGHQNWVKTTGEFLTFPGGGTQFKHGALHYIDFIQESLPNISWGKRSRVVLDVGCGVASFGGFLFERDVLTMSFAPKDEHEAQVQFALERGIPAISAVMGTKRLPYPSRVFDVIHCARCRVPWHIDGGMLLLELNRLLRPGGYFVWSATPVYRKLPEDAEIWKAMSQLTKSMCWEMVTKRRDPLEKISLAIYKKPSSNDCYERRAESNPPLCQDSDDPNAAWNVQLQACMHKVPVDPSVRGSQWPKQWPERLETPPYWLNGSQLGVYGQAAPEDFKVDYKHWKRVVSMSYLKGMGVNWSTVRNVMDMRSVYGGFAVALRDMKVWVMNVVSIESADTLPIIYERGLFGIYHDWCESFNTYPRTYDLLHADHLFSKTKKRCNLLSVLAEVDRILRPEGKMIVRDDVETIEEVDKIARSLKWQIRMTYSKENEGLLCVQKTMWRPQEVETTT